MSNLLLRAYSPVPVSGEKTSCQNGIGTKWTRNVGIDLRSVNDHDNTSDHGPGKRASWCGVCLLAPFRQPHSWRSVWQDLLFMQCLPLALHSLGILSLLLYISESLPLSPLQIRCSFSMFWIFFSHLVTLRQCDLTWKYSACVFTLLPQQPFEAYQTEFYDEKKKSQIK